MSQSTARMNRLGQPPIMKFGLRVEIHNFADNGNKDKGAMIKKAPSSTITKNMSGHREETLQKRKKEPIPDDISSLFLMKLGKQCVKGAESLMKMAVNFDAATATTKFYNSSVRLWDSCQKIIVVLSRKVIKQIKGSDDQGK